MSVDGDQDPRKIGGENPRAQRGSPLPPQELTSSTSHNSNSNAGAYTPASSCWRSRGSSPPSLHGSSPPATSRRMRPEFH